MDTEYKDLKEKGTEGLADLEQLQLEYMHLDLSSFQSVKGFVGAFKSSGRQLHVLICNAGVCKAKLGKFDKWALPRKNLCILEKRKKTRGSFGK